MAQFPFAHTIEMTYRLKDGTLEVLTKLNNLSTEPMPIALGLPPLLSSERRPARRVDVRYRRQDRVAAE
jgi:aldose 1-epimerase